MCVYECKCECVWFGVCVSVNLVWCVCVCVSVCCQGSGVLFSSAQLSRRRRAPSAAKLLFTLKPSGPLSAAGVSKIQSGNMPVM